MILFGPGFILEPVPLLELRIGDLTGRDVNWFLIGRVKLVQVFPRLITPVSLLKVDAEWKSVSDIHRIPLNV